jgi:hypothetical protein
MQAFGAPAMGKEVRVYLKFASVMTVLQALRTIGGGSGSLVVTEEFDDSDHSAVQVTYAVVIEPITVDFTPANMTWNNQATLTYATQLDAQLTGLLGLLFCKQYSAYTLNLYQKPLPGFAARTFTACYGLRIRLTVADNVGTAVLLKILMGLVPNQVSVMGKV